MYCWTKLVTSPRFVSSAVSLASKKIFQHKCVILFRLGSLFRSQLGCRYALRSTGETLGDKYFLLPILRAVKMMTPYRFTKATLKKDVHVPCFGALFFRINGSGRTRSAPPWRRGRKRKSCTPWTPRTGSGRTRTTSGRGPPARGSASERPR